MIQPHRDHQNASMNPSSSNSGRFGSGREVKRIEDFEGVVQLGLGVNGPACYRVSFLTNPSRLVIDVQAAG